MLGESQLRGVRGELAGEGVSSSSRLCERLIVRICCGGG